MRLHYHLSNNNSITTVQVSILISSYSSYIHHLFCIKSIFFSFRRYKNIYYIDDNENNYIINKNNNNNSIENNIKYDNIENNGNRIIDLYKAKIYCHFDREIE